MDWSLDQFLASPEGRLAIASLVLGALLLVFLPIEIWQRHRAGTLQKAVVMEMLASASVTLPALAVGGVVLAFNTAL